MNYSLLTYNFKKHFNLGDYIQSLAAKQFLPQIDQYINREELNKYTGPKTKIILNGWFMHHPENWPPSPKINPLFISFHINIKHTEGILGKKRISYLKQYEPIGCRDLNTLELLKKKDIQAYLSSCLTLTLGNKYRHRENGDIYIVDALFKYPTRASVFKNFNSLNKAIKNRNIFLLGKRNKQLREILGDDIVKTAKKITHQINSDAYPTEDLRFELAEKTLKCYEKARLVITSRIHCALPCLAMGTPVVFIDGGLENISEQCRLDGISNFFNTVKIIKNKNISSNFDIDLLRSADSLPSKTEHLQYLEALNKNCREFVKKDY